MCLFDVNRGEILVAVIQLGLDRQDDRLFWWSDQHLWDTRTEDGEEEPSTVKRPTERAALRQIYRQSRLLKKRGVFINLSPFHVEALQWEYYCRREYPHFIGKEYQWVSEQMGIPHLQVKGLLDECSLVVLLRDALGLTPLDIDWQGGTLVKRRKAA